MEGIKARYATGFEKSPPVRTISHAFSASSIDSIDIKDIFNAIVNDLVNGNLSFPRFNNMVSNNNDVLMPETQAAGTEMVSGNVGYCDCK